MTGSPVRGRGREVVARIFRGGRRSWPIGRRSAHGRAGRGPRLASRSRQRRSTFLRRRPSPPVGAAARRSSAAGICAATSAPASRARPVSEPRARLRRVPAASRPRGLLLLRGDVSPSGTVDARPRLCVQTLAPDGRDARIPLRRRASSRPTRSTIPRRLPAPGRSRRRPAPRRRLVARRAHQRLCRSRRLLGRDAVRRRRHRRRRQRALRRLGSGLRDRGRRRRRRRSADSSPTRRGRASPGR